MADGQAQGRDFPDSIDGSHVAGSPLRDRIASLGALILLAILLGTAMTGVLGGQPNPTFRVDTPAVSLAVKTPHILRNGMFFETEISVTPHRPMAELTIAVDRTLWKDFTVNTMIPAAAEETYADGRYRFAYGPAEAGKTIAVKVDSQINPALFGGTGGRIAVYDGEVLVAEVPVTIQVRP